MKTISDYTIYCTEEQTKKALKLGAPLQYANVADIRNNRFVNGDNECYATPTAEQMISWLEEQGCIDVIRIDKVKRWSYIVWNKEGGMGSGRGVSCDSRKEATLAAIEEALEYLTNSKE